MPVFEAEIEFSVYCKCGHGLCGQTVTGRDRWGKLAITVDPCEKCLDAARDEGYQDGISEGEE